MSERRHAIHAFSTQKRNSRNVEVEAFKPHAIKTAEAQKARHLNPDEAIDPMDERLQDLRQWRNHIVDLHRVLSVSQAMFLLLEHNNEALLRVAVEIATNSDSQKALWWQDGWYSDEVAREWFRKQVKEKLGNCMNAMHLDFDDSDDDKEDMDEITRTLLSKAEEAEKKRLEEQSRRESTELRLTEVKKAFEKALKDSTSQIKELEKSLDKMRLELKKTQVPVEDNTADTRGQRALEEAARQKMLLLEEQKRKAEEKLLKVENEHEVYVKKSVAAIGESQGKVKELESQVRQLNKRLELEQENTRKRVQQLELEMRNSNKPPPMAIEKKQALPEPVAKEPPPPPPERDHAVEDELKQSLFLEQKRAQEFRTQRDDYKTQRDDYKTKVSTLEGEAVTLKDEILSLKADVERIRAEARRPPANDERERPRPAPVRPQKEEKPVEEEKPVVEEEVARVRPQKIGIDEEEHQKVLQKLEHFRENNKRLRESNSELKTEHEALEKKNMQLLRMLNQVKEQLKRITEIAEKRGYGKIVNEIMEESKVTEMFESVEYTAFDRLWEDAKRRSERAKLAEEVRMGIRDRSELENWDSKHGVQKRSNGGHRGSFMPSAEEMQAPRKSVAAHSATHSTSHPHSPSGSSENAGRPVLCARCGGEVGAGVGAGAGAVCDSAASTWSSSWPVGTPNTGRPHADTAGVLADALRPGAHLRDSVHSIRSESPARDSVHSPQQAQAEFPKRESQLATMPLGGAEHALIGSGMLTTNKRESQLATMPLGRAEHALVGSGMLTSKRESYQFPQPAQTDFPAASSSTPALSVGGTLTQAGSSTPAVSVHADGHLTADTRIASHRNSSTPANEGQRLRTSAVHQGFHAGAAPPLTATDFVQSSHQRTEGHLRTPANEGPRLRTSAVHQGLHAGAAPPFTAADFVQNSHQRTEGHLRTPANEGQRLRTPRTEGQLSRPRTEGHRLRTPRRLASPIRSSPRETGFELFQLQGHGMMDGELSVSSYPRRENSRSPRRELAALDRFQVQGQSLRDSELNASYSQQPHWDDGRPHTTFAGPTPALSSSIINLQPLSYPIGNSRSQALGPKAHPMGLSQSQPVGNFNDAKGDDEAGLPTPHVPVQSSSMKLPTITEKSDKIPQGLIISSNEMVNSFQEALRARGMQGSASAPNLPSEKGSALFNNVMAKRSKTPGLKVGGLRRMLIESKSPPMDRNSRGGNRPMTSGLVMKEHGMQGSSASAPILSLPSVAGNPMQSSSPSKTGVRRRLLGAGPLEQTMIPANRGLRLNSGNLRPMTTGAESLSLALGISDFPPAKDL